MCCSALANGIYRHGEPLLPVRNVYVKLQLRIALQRLEKQPASRSISLAYDHGQVCWSTTALARSRGKAPGWRLGQQFRGCIFDSVLCRGLRLQRSVA